MINIIKQEIEIDETLKRRLSENRLVLKLVNLQTINFYDILNMSKKFA